MRPLYGNVPDPLDLDRQDHEKERRQDIDLLLQLGEAARTRWARRRTPPAGCLAALTGKPKEGKTFLAPAESTETALIVFSTQ